MWPSSKIRLELKTPFWAKPKCSDLVAQGLTLEDWRLSSQLFRSSKVKRTFLIVGEGQLLSGMQKMTAWKATVGLFLRNVETMFENLIVARLQKVWGFTALTLP